MLREQESRPTSEASPTRSELRGLRRELGRLLERIEVLTPPVVTRPLRVAVGNDAASHATRIRQLLAELHYEMEFFKRGTAEDRRVLVQILPGRDVGYLTSMLRAFYDEDQFERWKLFTQYTPSFVEE